MRRGAFLLAAVLSAVAPMGAAAEQATSGPPPSSGVFPRPASMEAQVRFWRAVFTEYSIHQVVVHDALHLDKIYTVIDSRPYLAEGMSEDQALRLGGIEADAALSRVRETLLRFDRERPKRSSLNAEERRIYDLFKGDRDPARFRDAADDKRLRRQRGLRERYAEAVRISRRYLPKMEHIFREEGLPIELTRLPFIESCFNVEAYSKVGAAGVWQFMPATGRRFIRVDDLVDERRDPIRSTHAAAQYLSRLYGALGSWPLAITAYNHGPEGIARAVRETGSDDIGVIVRKYQGRAFGFASRNFYAEFLAALDVDREREKYFGDLGPAREWDAHEHRLDRPVSIEVAARLARAEPGELVLLNPALSKSVVTGRRMIPRGYQLWMPRSGARGFDDRLAEYAAEVKVTRVASPAVTRKGGQSARTKVVIHRVRRGQTLSHIARQHKVTVSQLRVANRLNKAGYIRAGQVLKIPVR
jgi:membrane-bound lytic murein transglycosylase D